MAAERPGARHFVLPATHLCNIEMTAASSEHMTGLHCCQTEPSLPRASRWAAPVFVTPAQAGIHGRISRCGEMDFGFRRNDDK
jgi:hypothetical protein